jgi:hypothetical protein
VERKARVRLQPCEPVELQLGIVVIVEIVDADDRMLTLEQSLRDMHADEAGGSGDQNFHPTNSDGRVRKARIVV